MKFAITKTPNNWIKFENVEALQRFLEKYDIGKSFVADVSEPKIPRNNAQNALIHAMFMELDRLMHNNDPKKTKWQVLIEVGFYEEIEIKGNLEKLPLSTAGLERKPFADLCDRIIKWAWEFNQWDVRPPKDRIA